MDEFRQRGRERQPKEYVIQEGIDNGDLVNAAAKARSPFSNSTTTRELSDGDDDEEGKDLGHTITNARSTFSNSTTTRELTDGDDDEEGTDRFEPTLCYGFGVVLVIGRIVLGEEIQGSDKYQVYR